MSPALAGSHLATSFSLSMGNLFGEVLTIYQQFSLGFSSPPNDFPINIVFVSFWTLLFRTLFYDSLIEAFLFLNNGIFSKGLQKKISIP